MDIPEPRIQIAPMSLQTVEAVEALERECFANPWSLDSLVEELSNPMAVFFTAEQNGKIVGYAGMHHIIDEGYITNIAVTTAFRRRGVASQLLQALLSYAEQNDLAMLTLEVRASNEAAIALYKKFDFEQAGERKAYYNTPTENAIIMTCKL